MKKREREKYQLILRKYKCKLSLVSKLVNIAKINVAQENAVYYNLNILLLKQGALFCINQNKSS
jgi:hypothetical protein